MKGHDGISFSFENSVANGSALTYCPVPDLRPLSQILFSFSFTPGLFFLPLSLSLSPAHSQCWIQCCAHSPVHKMFHMCASELHNRRARNLQVGKGFAAD